MSSGPLLYSGGRRRKGPEGYLVEEHPRDDTHYRWPSPSLPPTLTKKPMKRGAAAVAKSKVAAAAANKKRPSPTSSEREMMFSSSTTSAGTESTSTGQRREVRRKSLHKDTSKKGSIA